MPYFQVGQKLSESEYISKSSTRRAQNTASHTQIPLYLNQNINVASNAPPDVKKKAKTLLQQSNQNVNVIPNQNNFVPR